MNIKDDDSLIAVIDELKHTLKHMPQDHVPDIKVIGFANYIAEKRYNTDGSIKEVIPKQTHHLISLEAPTGRFDAEVSKEDWDKHVLPAYQTVPMNCDIAVANMNSITKMEKFSSPLEEWRAKNASACSCGNTKDSMQIAFASKPDQQYIIRKIRRAKDFSQDKLARLAGIERSRLCRAERGYATLTENELRLMAEALEVDVTQLIQIMSGSIPAEDLALLLQNFEDQVAKGIGIPREFFAITPPKEEEVQPHTPQWLRDEARRQILSADPDKGKEAIAACMATNAVETIEATHRLHHFARTGRFPTDHENESAKPHEDRCVPEEKK
jgi:transcriptional regulator with XRE-family HTH domain